MISSRRKSSLEDLFDRAYFEGYARHGALGLERETLSRRLLGLIQAKGLADLSIAQLARSFDHLHYSDLYLAAACAEGKDAAWSRFSFCYLKYIRDVVRQFSFTSYIGSDLADNIIGELYLPDSSGTTRIGAYDGRSSLATWLRVLIGRRAMNEKDRKWNCAVRLEDVAQPRTETTAESIEATFRAHTYGPLLIIAIESAIERLNNEDRLAFEFLYRQKLTASEIARCLGISSSTMNYRIARMHQGLRRHITAELLTTHQISAAAIEEVLPKILLDPGIF